MSASPERGSGISAKGCVNPRVGFPSLDISVRVSSVGIGAGVSGAGVSSAGTSAGFSIAGFPSAGVPSAGFPIAGFPSAGVSSAGVPSAGTSDSVPNDGTRSQQEEFNKLLARYKEQIALLLSQVGNLTKEITDLQEDRDWLSTEAQKWNDKVKTLEYSKKQSDEDHERKLADLGDEFQKFKEQQAVLVRDLEEQLSRRELMLRNAHAQNAVSLRELHRNLGRHELELRNAQGLNEFLQAKIVKVLNEARIQSQEKTAEIYKLKLDIEALKARIIQLLKANKFLKRKDGSDGFDHDKPIPGLNDSLENFGISVDPSRLVDVEFDTQTGPEDSEFPGVSKTPADTLVPRGFTPSAGDTGGGASGAAWHSSGRPSGGADRPSGAGGAAWHSSGMPSGSGADRPSGSGAVWHIGGGASGGASGAGRPSGASGASGASGGSSSASASDSRYVKETLEPCFMIPYGITRSEINSLNEAEKRFTSRSRTKLINRLYSLTSSHLCTETNKGLKCRIPTCYECSRINSMLTDAIQDATTSLIAICKKFDSKTYSPNPIRPGSTFKTDYYYYTTLIRMYQCALDDFRRSGR